MDSYKPFISYDNLYKFQVSFGILLLVLPLLLHLLLLRDNFLVLSAEVYSTLSESSLKILEYKFNFVELWNALFPAVYVCCLFLGCFFIFLGVENWTKMQEVQDSLQTQQLKVLLSSIDNQTKKQISKNIDKDINELYDRNIRTNLEKSNSTEIRREYIHVSNLFYRYVKNNYNKYTIIRNGRIGTKLFDYIALDKNHMQDMIFEVKYIPTIGNLREISHHALFTLSENVAMYKASFNRNATSILFLVVPESIREKAKDIAFSQTLSLDSDLDIIFLTEKDIGNWKQTTN